MAEFNEVVPETENENIVVPVVPVQMVDVLDHIFKFLNIGDLVNCRTVCKQWMDVGTRFVVKKIDEIEIRFKDPYSNPEKCYEKSMVSFMDMAKECPFKFRYFSFYEIPMSNTQTEKLLNEFGSTMTKLKLFYDELSTNITSKQLADILTKKAPSLTELIIWCLPESINRNPVFSLCEELPELKFEIIKLGCLVPINSNIFVRDLFHSCKFLKSLAVYQSTFNALTTLLEHGSIENFQELEFGVTNCRTAGLLTRFDTAPMKRFAMKGTVYVTCGKSFQDFIQFINDHKDTWEHLELSFECESSSKFYFPIMENLKFLSMHFDNIDIQLDYQKQFPNLVTLKFAYGVPSSLDFDKVFPMRVTPLRTLKNLELPPSMTSKILRRIGQTFPNVVNVKMNTIPREVLTELWMTWPLVESLHITILNERIQNAVERSLDSIFSGIGDKDLLLAYMARHTEMIHSLRVDSSIRDLTKLRRLLIHQRAKGDFRISSVGAILSFVELNELRYFQVANTVHKIHPKVINKLCHKLQFGHLKEKGQLILAKYEWDQQFDPAEDEINDYDSPDEDDEEVGDESDDST